MSRVLRTLLIATAVVVVLIALAEGVARMAMPTDPHSEARLSFSNRIEGFEPVSELSLTGQGLRPADWRRRAGEPRILCLGTDNTFHLLQGDRGEWWGRLEKALRKEGGKARTVAMGGRGMTLVDLAAWLEQFDELGDFDAVVVLAGPSEVRARQFDSNLAADAPGVNPFRTVDGFRGQLVKHSGLVRVLRNSRGGFQSVLQNSYGPLTEPNAIARQLEAFDEEMHRVRLAPPERWRIPYLHVEGYEQDEPGLRRALCTQARKGLERIDAACERAGLPWLMVFEPTLEDAHLTPSELNAMNSVELLADQRAMMIDPYWVDACYGELATGLQQEARQRGGAFVDLRGVVPADLDHFHSERMLTDAGAEAVAAALTGPVRQLLAGQPVSQPGAPAEADAAAATAGTVTP